MEVGHGPNGGCSANGKKKQFKADHSGRAVYARTLGSWVRIPLKAWMFVCAFILCLFCPVCR
jgi:hypothetical protein